MCNERKPFCIFYNRVKVILFVPSGEWNYKDIKLLCLVAKLCQHHFPILSGIVMRVRWRR